MFKICGILYIYGTHLLSEFHKDNPNTGACGDDHRNKKNRIFDKRGIFQIKSQKRVLNLGKF